MEGLVEGSSQSERHAKAWSLLLVDVRTSLEQLRPSSMIWPTATAAHRDVALQLTGSPGVHRRSH